MNENGNGHVVEEVVAILPKFIWDQIGGVGRDEDMCK